LVLYFRLDPVTRQTVWAEDGLTFLEQNIQFGFWRSLFVPYAGYFQFVPRLIVEAAKGLFGLAHYAFGITVLTCLVCGFIVACTFVFAKAIMLTRTGQMWLTLIPILLPALPCEVLGNAANIHGFFLWLMPWLLLYSTKSRLGKIGCVILAVIACLTEFQVILFMPLLLYRFKDRGRWPTSIAFLSGCLVQIVVTMYSPRPYVPNTYSFVTIIGGYIYDVFAGAWTTNHVIDSVSLTVKAPTLFGAIAMVVVAGLMVAFVVIGLNMAKRNGQLPSTLPIMIMLGLVSIASFCAAAYVNDGIHISLSQPSRYAVVPSMLVLAIIGISGDRVFAYGNSKKLRVMAWVVMIAIIIAGLLSFQPNTKRSQGPIWDPSAQSAIQACQTASTDQAIIQQAPAGWWVTLPCSIVDG